MALCHVTAEYWASLLACPAPLGPAALPSWTTTPPHLPPRRQVRDKMLEMQDSTLRKRARHVLQIFAAKWLVKSSGSHGTVITEERVDKMRLLLLGKTGELARPRKPLVKQRRERAGRRRSAPPHQLQEYLDRMPPWEQSRADSSSRGGSSSPIMRATEKASSIFGR